MIIPPIRQNDSHGSGAFGASRGGRTHNGVDIACYAGSRILSMTEGVVTKFGYPYNPSHPKKGHYRYVEVTHDGLRYRYFYVSPTVSVGDEIKRGDQLGIAQGLLKLYPGITDHVHFEIKQKDGRYVDPTDLVAEGKS